MAIKCNADHLNMFYIHFAETLQDFLENFIPVEAPEGSDPSEPKYKAQLVRFGPSQQHNMSYRYNID